MQKEVGTILDIRFCYYVQDTKELSSHFKEGEQQHELKMSSNHHHLHQLGRGHGGEPR